MLQSQRPESVSIWVSSTLLTYKVVKLDRRDSLVDTTDYALGDSSVVLLELLPSQQRFLVKPGTGP